MTDANVRPTRGTANDRANGPQWAWSWFLLAPIVAVAVTIPWAVGLIAYILYLGSRDRSVDDELWLLVHSTPVVYLLVSVVIIALSIKSRRPVEAIVGLCIPAIAVVMLLSG